MPCFWSSPYFEDDHYRYIWDGWVSAHGANALVISPLEVLSNKAVVNDALRESKVEPLGYHGDRREREVQWRHSLLPDAERHALLSLVNYPESPSIYGPVAQSYLALTFYPLKILNEAGLVSFQLDVAVFCLRWSFLCLDACLCILFYLLARSLGSLQRCASFVMCPVLLKEIGNSLHVDILACVFCCLAVLGLLGPRKWPKLSCLALVCACAVKPYALILMPWLALWSGGFKRYIGGFVALFALCYLPWYGSGGSEIWTGTRYFSSLWSMNDFFPALCRELLYHGTELGFSKVDMYPIGEVWVSQVQWWARSLSLLMFVLAWCSIGFWHWRNKSMRELCELEKIRLCGWLVLLMLFFSPVQNPWYLIWGLPFWCLVGFGPGMIWLSLAFMYYFNFIFEATAHLFHPFQWWVVLPQTLVSVSLVLAWFRYSYRSKTAKLASKPAGQ